jgi:hypothetical protein
MQQQQQQQQRNVRRAPSHTWRVQVQRSSVQATHLLRGRQRERGGAALDDAGAGGCGDVALLQHVGEELHVLLARAKDAHGGGPALRPLAVAVSCGGGGNGGDGGGPMVVVAAVMVWFAATAAVAAVVAVVVVVVAIVVAVASTVMAVVVAAVLRQRRGW